MKQTATKWTEERIRAFGVRMPTLTAVEAVYGVKETQARAMLRRGEVEGLRVLRAGRQQWTPTVDVLRVLGLLEERGGGTAA